MDKQYIGEAEVTGIIEDSFETNDGTKVVNVMLDNGHTVAVTQKIFDIIVTNEPSDSSVVQEKIAEACSDAILNVMSEFSLSGKDFKVTMDMVVRRYQERFDRVSHFLWTGDDMSWTPGAGEDFQVYRSLTEADRIIATQIPPREIKEESNDDEESEETTE